MVGEGGFAEKEGFKPAMKEWGVMDDESGESMEPTEEVPATRRTRWVRTGEIVTGSVDSPRPLIWLIFLFFSSVHIQKAIQFHKKNTV